MPVLSLAPPLQSLTARTHLCRSLNNLRHSASMNRPVRLGFVGAGFVGQVAHIANYAGLDGCELTAVAELRPRLREAVRERYGFRRAYGHHSELLADPDIDAVVVVVPRPQIGPIALDCLNAGKHVLTEKPMAGTSAQAETLLRAAAANRVLHVVGYQRLHDEGVAQAVNLVHRFAKTREMGRLTYIRAHCFNGNSYCGIDGNVVTDELCPASLAAWPATPSWVPSARRADYASYLNVYSHNVSLMRRLAMAPAGVRSVAIGDGRASLAVLDFGAFHGVLETGHFGYHRWDEVTEVYFEQGRVRIVSPPAFLRNVAATVEVYRGGDAPQQTRPVAGSSWSFRRQAKAFVATVAHDAPTLSPATEAAEDLRLIESIWRAELGLGEVFESMPAAAAG